MIPCLSASAHASRPKSTPDPMAAESQPLAFKAQILISYPTLHAHFPGVVEENTRPATFHAALRFSLISAVAESQITQTGVPEVNKVVSWLQTIHCAIR